LESRLKAAASCRTPKAPSGRKNYAGVIGFSSILLFENIPRKDFVAFFGRKDQIGYYQKPYVIAQK
jgi:hypothetical protein